MNRKPRDFLKSKSLHAREGIKHALAVVFCLVAPFVVFLSSNFYDLSSPETSILYLVALAIGSFAFFAVIFRFDLVAKFVLWASIVLAIAFLIDGLSLRMLALTSLFVGFLMWLLKGNTTTIALLIASIHVGSLVALDFVNRADYSPLSRLPQSGVSERNPGLPPVLHLLLDEFSGLQGISTSSDDGPIIAAQISAQYVENGFDVSSHAYSQYFESNNSIPHIVNFSSGSIPRNFVDRDSEGYILNRNDYFRDMVDRGYSIHVYQSQYLDFCSTESSPIASCGTYPTNSVGTIADLDLPVLQKSKFIFNSYVDSALTLRKLRRSYDKAIDNLRLPLPRWRTGNSFAGQIAVLQVVEDLNSKLVSILPGEMYFAHLLLPHYPYSLNSDCSVKQNVGDWLNRVPFEISHPTGQQNTSESRKERYLAYHEQLECVHVMLDKTFAAIRSSGHWDDSVIIIHGDHGSRIVQHHPLASNLEEMTTDDFRDAYSTFFAVKSRASIGTVNPNPSPIQSLLADVWQIPDDKVDPGQVYMRRLDTNDKLATTTLLGFDSDAD